MSSRCGSLAALVVLACLPGQVHAQFPPSVTMQEVEHIAGRLYAFRQGAYRSIFIVTDAGVIATDPVSTTYARAYRDEIAKITDRPVRYVVYSQSQWDRTRGGMIFKDEGARFITHERCLENLRNVPHPEVVMPDITYADHYRVELGGAALELHYFGPSHDNCLSVMVAKPENVLFVTNVVNPPDAMVPWNPTLANQYLHNYIPFFRAVEALAEREDIRVLVGGFMAIGPGPDGKPISLPGAGPVTVVAEQRLFWEKVMTAVQTALEAGVPVRELGRRIDMAPFEKYPLYNRRYMEIVFRRVASLYATGR